MRRMRCVMSRHFIGVSSLPFFFFLIGVSSLPFFFTRARSSLSFPSCSSLPPSLPCRRHRRARARALSPFSRFTHSSYTSPFRGHRNESGVRCLIIVILRIVVIDEAGILRRVATNAVSARLRCGRAIVTVSTVGYGGATFDALCLSSACALAPSPHCFLRIFFTTFLNLPPFSIPSRRSTFLIASES